MIYLTAGFGYGLHCVLSRVSMHCGGNLEAFEISHDFLFPKLKSMQEVLKRQHIENKS